MARLERTVDLRRAVPTVVSVLPLDERTATSPVSAALAVLLNSTMSHPVAAVDGDGTAQPLRALLGSTGAGDLVGLAASHDASLRRRSVEAFVDMGARVPLASCWIDGPGAFPPAVFRDAAWKLRRRFPTLVIDVPHGVPRSTLGVATDIASHVVLVGAPDDLAHDWLHQGKSVLADLARESAVTIVAVGGADDTRQSCHFNDVVPIGSLRGVDANATMSESTVYGLAEVAARVAAGHLTR